MSLRNGQTTLLEQIFRTLWHAPKKQTHTLRMEKGVKINGEVADWTVPLKMEDILEIHFFQEADFIVQPTFYDVPILFEDDHLLVVNKPANMDTHPNSPDQNDTLSNAVAFIYLQRENIDK